MPSDRQLIYLAAPYSSPEPTVRRARFKVVNETAARLMAAGEPVFSPVTHGHCLMEAAGGFDQALWNRYDSRAIFPVCKRLVVLKLDGWEESVGVRAEIAIASEMGLAIEYMEAQIIGEEHMKERPPRAKRSVTVRVALSISDDGDWCAGGGGGSDGDYHMRSNLEYLQDRAASVRSYWIEVEVPETPAPTVIKGEVTKS